MTGRVTFINPIGGIGGAERVLIAMVRQLRTLHPGLQLSVIPLGEGKLIPALTALGADVRSLQLPTSVAELGDTHLRERSRRRRLSAFASAMIVNGPRLLKYLHRLRAILHELRPDVLHSNGLKAHMLSALAAPPQTPRLWHVHDFYTQRPVMAQLLRLVSHRASAAVAISDAVRRDLQRSLPGVPIKLVYNAVDTDYFHPTVADRALLDALAGVAPAPPGTLRIGLVATYATWKGHQVFLRAAQRLSDNPTLRFYIIGGPIYSTVGSQYSRADLQQQARQLGIADRVVFVPFQSDMAPCYRALDVMVHASTRPEPFGLTIVEAMACGVTTIVSNDGGASELFSDGIDAIGHQSGDDKSLADAIQRLAADDALRVRLGTAARATAVERFNEIRLGREMAELIGQYLPDRAINQNRTALAPAPPVKLEASTAFNRVPGRIAFLNPIGGMGGGERSLLRILSILRSTVPEVECRLLVGGDGPLIEQANSLGITVERIPMSAALNQFGESGLRNGTLWSRVRTGIQIPATAWSTLRACWWLRAWFRRNQPSLIHSNGMKTHILSSISRPQGVPLIWHIRDFLGGRPLMRWSLRWFAPRASLAIANSDAVAANARPILGGLPVKMLHNTVDTDHFSPGPGDGGRLDAVAGLPAATAGTLRIGLVAMYANWKGHDVLLRAFARLPAEPPTRLYLVGEPIYSTPGSQFSHEELETLATNLGVRDRIGFVPFQDDTAPVFRDLDIVVHASVQPEPFGLTIAEAMACGRPVVVSNAGGASELFTDGQDGLGHEPGDVAGLAAALQRLIADPDLRQRLGEAARESAVSNFNVERFRRKLLGMYAELIA